MTDLTQLQEKFNTLFKRVEQDLNELSVLLQQIKEQNDL